MLFVLTALEVGLYEITYGGHAGPSAETIKPFFVPMLLLLSAAKFALVAMFYMHLKQDSKLFTGVFVFPLAIATFIVVGVDDSTGVPLHRSRGRGNAGRAATTDGSLPVELVGSPQRSHRHRTSRCLVFLRNRTLPAPARLAPAVPLADPSFCAALLVLLLSLNGPVHDLSDYYLFSIHMAQHLLLTLLFPPLLLAGIPAWLLRPVCPASGCTPGGAVAHAPLVCRHVLQHLDSGLASQSVLRAHDAEP